jgi:hypothetical protein
MLIVGRFLGMVVYDISLRGPPERAGTQQPGATLRGG